MHGDETSRRPFSHNASSSLMRLSLPPCTISLPVDAQVTGEVCDFPGFSPKGPGGIVELNRLYSAAAAALGATYVDAMVAVAGEAEEGGGSGGGGFISRMASMFTPRAHPRAREFTPAEENTHADLIHLNNKGYCRLFTYKAVQAFFGCAEGEGIDCDKVSLEVPGCGSGSGASRCVVS